MCPFIAKSKEIDCLICKFQDIFACSERDKNLKDISAARFSYILVKKYPRISHGSLEFA